MLNTKKHFGGLLVILSRLVTGLIIAVLLCVWLPKAEAQGAPAPSPYTGVDIVFLVDQSGSMSGAYGQVPSDPQGLRFQSMQFASRWLGDFAHSADPESIVRIAVVGFGDPQRTTLLTWDNLSPVGENQTQWESHMARNNLLLSDSQFGPRHFGYTNFEGAFQIAQNLFDNAQPLPNNRRNLRVIMVITDGAPCAVDDADDIGNCGSQQKNEAQLQRVSALVGKAFPKPDYRIYFLGITPPDENSGKNPPAARLDNYANDWKDIIAEPFRYNVVTTAGDMTGTLLTYMNDIRQQISTALVTYQCILDSTGECPVDVPPYIRLIRFNVFKRDAAQRTQISLTSPDGKTIQGGDPGITISSTTTNIEVWTVPFPQYGQWHIRVDTNNTNNVEVAIDQAFMQSTLVEPGKKTYYQWQSVPIAPYLFYQVDNSTTGRPVSILKDFPLTVTANIQSPNQTNEQVALQLIDNPQAGAQQPQYRGTFVPNDAGTYTITLKGVVPNIQNPANKNETYTPLDTDTAARRETVEIHQTSVTVEPDAQLLQQSGHWLATDPTNVCVIIKDYATGNRVPDLDKLQFEAVIPRPNSSGDEQKSALTYQPDLSAHCTFFGTITPDTPGESALYVRGYLTKPDGTQSKVYDNNVLNVTIDPVQYVRLVVREPVQDNTSSDVVLGRPFFNAQPLVTQVEAVNAADGTPVDLDALLNNADEMPIHVQVLRGGGLEDVTGANSLTKLSESQYELNSTDFGPGTYQVVMTGAPLPLKTCHCAYAPADSANNLGSGDRAQRIIERVIPLSIIIWAIVALVVVVLLAIIVRWIALWTRDSFSYPLTGTLYLIREYQVDNLPDLQQDQILIPLNGRRNTVRRKAKQISTQYDLPFKSIEVTNWGVDGRQEKDGRVRVRVFMKDGRVRPYTIYPGGEPVEIFADGEAENAVRFLLQKDPDSDLSTDMVNAYS